jgi:hypothetical protein
MRIPCKSSALLVVLCLLLAGCGGKQSEESPKTESAKPAATPAAEPQGAPAPAQTKPDAASAKPAKPAATAPAKAAAASTEPAKPAFAAPAKPATATAEPAQPAVTSTSAPAAAPVAQEKKVAPKDVALLKGGALGAVKFQHKLHVERAGKKCETCHHASRPEKPGTAAQQSCLDCHTRPPAPGMKTGLPAAFHNAAAQAGTCIDCHKRENAQGKMAPTKCLDCHKKENT